MNEAKLNMVVESGDGAYHGRVHYEDDLLVASATSLEKLKVELQKALFDFHDLDPKSYEFEVGYDLTAFFEHFDYLNMTKLANKLDFNPSLLRAYAKGIKFPSESQVNKLKQAIHKIGNELLMSNIVARV